MILYVEDNPGDVGLFREACRLSGIRVELLVAADGEEALEFAKRYPDLIVLDLVIPRIDGLQVLKELKNSPHTALIPVIVYAAISAKANVREAYEIGANAFVPKGISLDDSIAAVQEICEVWLVRAELPRYS